jgi:leucyl-tRNA synthetase
MFAAPPEQSLEWSETGVEGAHRFLKRLWVAVADHTENKTTVGSIDSGNFDEQQKAMRLKLHETIKKVSDDYSRRLTFNTAIAANMELLNSVNRFTDGSANGRVIRQEVFDCMVLMLAPIVPHLCHRLWQNLGHQSLIIDHSWPRLDEAALQQDNIEMVIQVNGKLRGKMKVSVDADREFCEASALENEQVRRFIGDQAVKKVIVVPAKLVNIVI